MNGLGAECTIVPLTVFVRVPTSIENDDDETQAR